MTRPFYVLLNLLREVQDRRDAQIRFPQVQVDVLRRELDTSTDDTVFRLAHAIPKAGSAD